MGSYRKAKPNWGALDLCPLRIRRSAPSTEQLWKMTQSAAATSGQRLGSDLHWNLPQRILCFAAQCAVHTTFQNRHCKNFVSQPFVWGRWEHCRQCPSYFCFWFYQLCPTVPRQMQTTEQEDHTRLLSSDSLHCTGVLLLFVAEPIFFLRFAIRIIFEFFLHLIRMTELIILLGQIWWVEQSDQWEIQFVFNKNHSQSPVDTSFNFFFVKLDLNPIYWQTLIDLHWHQKKYLTGVVCKHTALFIYGTTAPDDVICMSQPRSQSLSTSSLILWVLTTITIIVIMIVIVDDINAKLLLWPWVPVAAGLPPAPLHYWQSIKPSLSSSSSSSSLFSYQY